MGVDGHRHAPAALLSGKDQVSIVLGGWVGLRAGLDGCGKSRPPTGIRSPDRPDRSEPLYRLNYPETCYSINKILYECACCVCICWLTNRPVKFTVEMTR